MPHPFLLELIMLKMSDNYNNSLKAILSGIAESASRISGRPEQACRYLESYASCI